MSLSNTVLDTRFRSALDRMAERGRLATYSAPVDPYLEAAGLMKKLDGGPALLFSKVTGHDMPVIGNLLSCQANVEAAFGTDFRNIGVRLPVLEIATLYISFSRLIAFAVGLIGAVAPYLFLKRTYIGTAIRAIAQDREIVGLMGVDQRRIYLVTSAIGGALAGLAACLLALQYDVHPHIGNTFGPVIFMICVLGGLGNMIGGFIASFIISQIIAIGGYYANTELSYVLAFTFFIVLMFVRPRGIFAR